MIQVRVDKSQGGNYVFAFILGSLAFVSACAHAESVWNSANSGSWLEPLNWTASIPNAAGDSAHLTWTPAKTISVTVPSPIVVGQLILSGPSTFSLTGAGPLTFDSPAPNGPLLKIDGSPKTHQILVPVDIADGEQLSVDVVANATISLNGGLMTGTGGITKSNAGTLQLSTASATWDGALTINGGIVDIRNADALGSATGVTAVNTGGTLAINAGVTIQNELIKLAGGTLQRGGSGTANINSSIELVANSTIHSDAPLVINAAITGGGGVIFSTSSGIYLYGNNTYQGLTTIGPGTTAARSPNALGTPDQGTVILTGGQLVIEQPTLEPLTLRGGTVNLASAVTSTGAITLESGNLQLPSGGQFTTPIVLANIGLNPTIDGRDANLTGGVTGVGDLIFSSGLNVSGQPLAQSGGLIVSNSFTPNVVTLNSANTYAGPTKVQAGLLIVNHANALGTSSGAIQVGTGTLQFNEVVQRDITINQGIFADMRSDEPYNKDISIRMGEISGQGLFNGKILMQTAVGSNLLRGGTFNGVIGGDSNVDFGLNDQHIPVTLNAQNTYTGTTRVYGTLNANTNTALGTSDRATVVSSFGILNVNADMDEKILVMNYGRVNLNGHIPRLPLQVEESTSAVNTSSPTVAVNVPSTFHQHYDINQGVLQINADTYLDSLSIRRGGTLDVKSGTLTTAATEIDLRKGSLNGKIAGPTVIRKSTNEFAYLGDLPVYDGDVIVDGGVLQIASNNGLGSQSGDTRVGHRDAVLQLLGPMTLLDNIYLDNANGPDHTGGIFLADRDNDPVTILQGRLDLGSVGSTIGSGDCSSCSASGFLETHGPITGGSLTTVGRHTFVRIMGGDNTYSGDTDIRGGEVILSGSGRIGTSSAIVLHDSSDSSTGILDIDNSAGQLDRVADSIPIDFRGGKVRLENGSEKFGLLKFAEGASQIEAQGNISFASFQRMAGATGVITSKNGVIPLDSCLH